MKKLLAMVLALVMTLSLAVSANAAFKDDKSISDDYAEAVAVLNGMGVFKGYEDGSFKPQGNITRAEVATIVYRIYTADVAKNDKSGLYATYNKFSDMAGASWAAGYIGYCANASLVKGYPDGTFKPSGNVTGYEVLAMILRAVGYDKNNEFSGADWALHVAQTAQQLGVLDNVAKTTDLNAPASRELVAELLFQGIQKAQVTYTPAFGYVTDKVISTKTNSLGEKNFKLAKKAASDEWGRPATTWTYNTGDKTTTFVEKPDLTYTKAVTECDVAHDAGLKADTAYALYVNGDLNATKYIVNLTDTTTKMGAQGRLVEVYDDTIVMIDTFLAKVTSVSDATYDAQGHLRAEATITLAVFDGPSNGTTKMTSDSTADTLVLKNGETNYPYAKGDYVLLNTKTADVVRGAKNTSTTSGLVITAADKKYGEIVAKAETITGAQTIIYWNAQQHNVGGTVYDDAYKFLLDDAKQDSGNYTWYLDQYGNLIGATTIEAATSYGVINSIWWAGNAADGSGVAKANVTYMDGTTAVLDISTLIYNGATENRNTTYTAMGGKLSHNTATNKVMSGDAYSTAPTSYFYIDSYIDQNARADVDDTTHGAKILNDDMFQFTTQANGTVKAVEVSGAGTAAAYKNLHSENLAIYKDTQITSGLVANSNTVYLIRSGLGTPASPYTFKSVTGFDKIDRYQNDEVDYVMSDGFAKYVFIKADPTESKVTSVFFYAGEQASFNNETGVWTIPGYLDGEKTAIYAVGWNNSNVNTIIDTTTGRGNANTIYCVALSNGYLDKDYTSAWVYTSTDPIRAASVHGVTYPLAAAYMERDDVKVLTIQGSSTDTFEGNVYTHNGAKYSVVSNADFASKINGEFTNLGDKVIYLAYISGSGEYSGSILYANIVDADTTVSDPVNYKPTLTVTPVASNANSVPSIDINGTTSIAVSHNTNKVTLNLNYKTGVGINTVTMKVNGEDVVLGGGSGTCTYVYTVTSADLLRQFITVDLTTSVDNGATVKDSSSYKIAITGSLVEQ